MSIATDLNVHPYYDDYDSSKDYYKILFQPGVAVQTRELNQLQTLFQNQIEKFGDNIFQSGTIVSGCNFLFLGKVPYIKIKDQTVEGGSVSPSAYVFYRVTNETTGLSAQVTQSYDGYESADPDLKTLYLNYINTGYDANTFTFASGDVLTVYDGTTVGIEKVSIANNAGGSGFSNTDPVIIIPEIAITVLTGTFSNGEYITNGSGANLQIIAVDTVTLANSNQTILKLKPRTVDLANASATANSWTISMNESILDIDSSATATVTKIFGSGFYATALTDPNGTIINIDVSNKGFGFDELPFITIQSADNGSGIDALDLVPQNYVTQISVATVANTTGHGCLFGINEGVIYQKGYFLRVLSQSIVVDKYSTVPDGVAVGFTTQESIINSNLDTSLNDPAYTKNQNAPGANRLKLVPKLTLTTIDNALSNTNILPLVEYSEGKPYIQRQKTVYSKIGDKIAEGIDDTSGNFFINPFLITTQSDTANDTAASFDTIIDPGTAYISGYKVSTQKNYTSIYPVSFLEAVQNNFSYNLNYGKYIRLNNVGGSFEFNTGDIVTLYDTAKQFGANSTLVYDQNTNPVGVSIGTARMRYFGIETLTPGNPIYDLYIFDIQMANGKSFSSTRSIHYNGTANGVADIVTETNTTTGLEQAVIIDPTQNQLVFPISSTTIRNIANVTYQYRTFDDTLTVNTSGYIVKSVSSNTNLFFPFTGDLTSSQLTDLYVVPTSIDLVYAANTSGTVSVNTSSANLTGSSTNFLSEYVVGDWLYIYDAASHDLKQVQRVVNNTLMTVDSNISFTNATSNMTRVFPKDIPIPFGMRSGLSANVDVGQNILTINLGGALTTGSPQPISLGVNINQVDIGQGTKTPVRNAYVLLQLSNNENGVIGPWCLGVPDVFRLRGVYIGNSSVNSSSTDYFKDFYIDNNQTLEYRGLSWFYKKPTATVNLTSSQYILVKFDYFTSSGPSYYNPVSYISSNVDQIIAADSLSLNGLDENAGSINTWEIPEFFNNENRVDLLKCIDFRPSVANTCVPSTNYATAPTNPDSTKTFDNSEKYFPVPETVFTTNNVTTCIGNFITFFIDKDGNFSSANSTITGNKVVSAKTPPDNIKIADIIVPDYPAIPINKSIRLTELLNTGVLNQKYSSTRQSNHTIAVKSVINQNEDQVYTQKDIGKIDRRLKNVEYYVSLNQLETTMNNLIIPSVNDPALARYKFGFFAVDYSQPELLDMGDPQWAATNKDGYMWPDRLDWDIYFGNEGGALPYMNELIISQQNATTGTLTNPDAIPDCAIDVANTVAYQLKLRSGITYINNFNIILADAEHMANTVSVGMGANRDYWNNDPTSSSVEVFFITYTDAIKIEIYQGNTLIVDTSSAENLSAIDISNLTGSNSNKWFYDPTGIYLVNFTAQGNNFVTGSGKVTWDYNGTGGTAVTIKTTRLTNPVLAPTTSGEIRGGLVWKEAISYPVNGSTAGCAPPPPTIPWHPSPIPDLPPIDIDYHDCGNGMQDANIEWIPLDMPSIPNFTTYPSIPGPTYSPFSPHYRNMDLVKDSQGHLYLVSNGMNTWDLAAYKPANQQTVTENPMDNTLSTGSSQGYNIIQNQLIWTPYSESGPNSSFNYVSELVNIQW